MSRKLTEYYDKISLVKNEKHNNKTTGADIALATLVEEGVRYIFGVPGTSELQLLHSLPKHPSLEYIICLHESVAVGMADGFTRATSDYLGIANLHATQGTLNGIGSIRVAYRDGIPLFTLSGAPGTGYAIYEPNHSLRTISSVMNAVTKWSWQATSVSDIPRAIHRGITLAHATPPGPTHVFIPQDFLNDSEEVSIPSSVWRKMHYTAPSPEAIQVVLDALSKSSRPIIFAGNGVAHAQAVTDLVSLVEQLQIPVVSESVDRGPAIQAVVFPNSHPLHLGYFSSRNARIVSTLANADLVIILGAKSTWTRVVGSWIQSANIVQIDQDGWELGKSHPIAIGIVSNIRHAVKAINKQAKSMRMTAFDTKWIPQQISPQSSLEKEKSTAQGGIHPAHLVSTLNTLLDKSTIIVDDSQSLGYFLKRGYTFSTPNTLYGSQASHLGWGLPAALGVQLARPKQRVVCLLSDTSFLLSPHGLWTAARYHIPVIVVVVNNRGFASLRSELTTYGSASSTLDLTRLNEPNLNIATIAQGFGVKSYTVSSLASLNKALKAAIKNQEPAVLDVSMTSDDAVWQKSWFVPSDATL